VNTTPHTRIDSWEGAVAVIAVLQDAILRVPDDLKSPQFYDARIKRALRRRTTSHGTISRGVLQLLKYSIRSSSISGIPVR
jgi:hypothetical protein